MNVKKRFLSLFTVLLLVMSLVPALPASASVRYGFYVADVEVTDENKDDILGNGNFKYDSVSNTLSVYGDLIFGAESEYGNGNGIVNRDNEGLTINVVNDSVIKIENNWASCFDVNRSTTITGKGKLTLISQATSMIVNIESYRNGDIIIKDANIECRSENDGFWSTTKNGKLIIDNSSIKMTNKYYSICRFPKGIELIDCTITEPSDYSITSGTVYDENNYIASEITIIPVLPVERADLTVSAPEEGKSVSNGVRNPSAEVIVSRRMRTSGSSRIMTVFNVGTWYLGSDVLTTTDVYADGKTYELRVRLSAAKGYKLTKDTKVYVNGMLASTTATDFSSYVTYSVKFRVGGLLGDVNGDGFVNMKDLAALQRHINGWNIYVVEANCDVNDDGFVNLKDLAALQRLINSMA